MTAALAAAGAAGAPRRVQFGLGGGAASVRFDKERRMERIWFGQRVLPSRTLRPWLAAAGVASLVGVGIAMTPACSKTARDGAATDAAADSSGDGGGGPSPRIDAGGGGGIDGSPPGGEDPVLVGAGDIGNCDSQGDEATADLLDSIDGTIFVAGDLAYDDGTYREFMACFDPSWGRHKARIKPTPGNHEYYSDPPGSGYFRYFGAAAGDPDKGYYSYDLGKWHIIVLNTNRECEDIPCDAGSAQETWLREDLAAHPTACTLAVFHHPRFSSGDHGNNDFVQDLWQALDDGGVDVALQGHDHSYERFAPQDASGRADPAGIRSFVVGTGGVNHYEITDAQPNSEVRNDDTHGVLKLTLHPTSYSWAFVPVAGKSFADAGRGDCH